MCIYALLEFSIFSGVGHVESPPFLENIKMRFAWPVPDQDLTNSTSSVMATSSPSRRPPVSSAEFQVSPKSLRLIFVTPRIFDWRARALNVEDDLMSHAVYCK